MPASLTTVVFISVIAFVAVILAIQGGYLLWQALDIPSVIRVNRRLREISATGIEEKEALSILREHQFSQIPALNKLLIAIPRLHALDHLLEQAGMSVTLSVSRFLGIQLGITAILTLVLFFIFKWLFVISFVLSAAIGISLPFMFVFRRRKIRQQAFSDQLPETLDFMSRSLRAGNPLLITIKAVSENMPEPSSTEFGITFDELNYGRDLNEALHHLGERTGSEDMRFFITAVLIQRNTGGNLAEILNRISDVMRSRASTYREINILTTEMEFSANTLLALPFIVAGLISLTQPGYLKPLFTTDLGLLLVGAQLFLMGVGYLVVHKMINLKV